MSAGKIIAGVLLFAAATAFLYAWGLKKSLGQQEDLTRALMNACGSRVLRYLKTHEAIPGRAVEALIAGVTVRQFWSRNRLTVQDPAKVRGQVIAFLLDQQYIQPAGNGRYKRKI